MNFVDAISQATDVAQCLKSGLQALGTNSAKISVPKNSTRDVEGSVDIDTCVKHIYPEYPRWDYVFGYKRHVYYVEVHPACTSDVSDVIAKLNWLKQWRKHSAHLEGLSEVSSYHWIASNGVNITKSSKYSRKLASVGIVGPCSRLNL